MHSEPLLLHVAPWTAIACPNSSSIRVCVEGIHLELTGPRGGYPDGVSPLAKDQMPGPWTAPAQKICQVTNQQTNL